MDERYAVDVAGDVARDLVGFTLAQSPGDVHIALTGGRVGGEVSRSLVEHVGHLRNVHLWFSDERFLPAGHPDRNDTVVPAGIAAHVHRIPGPDAAPDAASSARTYMSELHQYTTTRFCSDNSMMDVTLLSIGPDGHIASLFPHSAHVHAVEGVVAVADSPKPPRTRVTWTLPTINASRQVWLLAAGAEKRDAVNALRSGTAVVDDLPAVGVHGRTATRLYTDQV